ncbi:MAG: hypothetical protein WD314_05795 [Trueperaceae bacterium]
MQRWAITLDGEVRRRLTQEQLELGTEIADEDGERLLVFRDRFVGLRVASTAGVHLLPYKEPAGRKPLSAAVL